MDAKTVVEVCKGKDVFELINFSILNNSSPLPPNNPIEQLTKEELFPSTPCICLDNGWEIVSPHFKDYCMNNPIVVIRDLAKEINMNLNLFSSKTLAEANPTHNITVYKQIKQISARDNSDALNRKIWRCYNRLDLKYKTIAQYAQYQHWKYTEARIQSLQPEALNLLSEDNKDIYVGTNVYLSGAKQWKLQLQELEKLPPFFQVKSADDMLSYMDYEIPGMNTVKLYMMVSGCRITGGQESNNFCAVNINVGSDDCEWFAVSDKYWGAVQSLCERNGVDYLRHDWWPPGLSDLIERNIPVYNFRQRAGDLVWVNVGCVYWVQSQGCCNNLTWNIGPLIVKQYQCAIERYEWNRLQSIPSPVPMIRLSWNLACKVKISDPYLFKLIKNTLLLTLKQYCLLMEFINGKNMIVMNLRRKARHYCTYCCIELFNIIFIHMTLNKYCFLCMLNSSFDIEEFFCGQEYDMCDLMDIYDKFILHIPSASSISSVSSLSSLSSLSSMESTSKKVVTWLRSNCE